MKIICLSSDCGFLENLDSHPDIIYNSEAPYIYCPECNKAALITETDRVEEIQLEFLEEEEE